MTSRCIGLLLLLGSLAAPMPLHAACVAEEGGIGGTGIVAEGGIGGTGAVARGGIGGTGIVGAITGFASICVNGLEVHFDESAVVTVNGEPADTRQLAVGQVVAVQAENSPKGLVTRDIAVLHVLEGPVTGTGSVSDAVLVMGRTVRLGADTQLGGLSGPGDLEPGSLVQVSGYLNAQGEVAATRIQRVEKLHAVSAIGHVADLQGGAYRLDGLPVSSAAGLPPPGGEVLVRGAWNGEALVATQMRHNPSLPFAGRVERLVVEGLVLRASADRMKISGFEVRLGDAIQVSGGSRDELVEGRRIRISGMLEGGHILRAERIELGRGARQAPFQKPLSPGSGMNERMSPAGHAARMERMERIERPERMEVPAGMERMDRWRRMDMCPPRH